MAYPLHSFVLFSWASPDIIMNALWLTGCDSCICYKRNPFWLNVILRYFHLLRSTQSRSSWSQIRSCLCRTINQSENVTLCAIAFFSTFVGICLFRRGCIQGGWARSKAGSDLYMFSPLQILFLSFLKFYTVLQVQQQQGKHCKSAQKLTNYTCITLKTRLCQNCSAKFILEQRNLKQREL